MKIMIFTSEQEYVELADAIRSLGRGLDQAQICHLDSFDALRRELVDVRYDLVIVTVDGALGMEVCIGTRKIRPNIPLMWFSNDQNFGPQSYRMACTYFACKPVSRQRLERAFLRLQEESAFREGRGKR